MKKKLNGAAMAAAAALTGLMLMAAPSFAGVTWDKSGSDGEVVDGAMPAGNEADGETLYACVAQYNGGMHPGKLREAFGGCNIGYGGKEVTVRKYYTAVGNGRWKGGENGYVPPKALRGGREANGQPLYVCRASYQNGVHLGKIRAEFRGCNIPFGGKEVMVPKYQVLVKSK